MKAFYFPVGSRSQEEYPTPCELCEPERSGFDMKAFYS